MTAYGSIHEAEILEASPLKLIELLYRGAIDAVRDARGFLMRGDIENRSRAVSKASAIIIELMTSLDHSQGGELTRTLVELYDYVLRRLNEGNFKQDDAPFAEVERLLLQLLEGWASCTQAETMVPADWIPTGDAEMEHVSVMC